MRIRTILLFIALCFFALDVNLVQAEDSNFIARNWQRFVGKRSIGSGHCVALVQKAIPDLGTTPYWYAGDKVQGNMELPIGTPIATFSKTGRYTNSRNGFSHAAIYLGQGAEGITVLDQFRGKRPRIRLIGWTGHKLVSRGTAYRVIESRYPMYASRERD